MVTHEDWVNEMRRLDRQIPLRSDLECSPEWKTLPALSLVWDMGMTKTRALAQKMVAVGSAEELRGKYGRLFYRLIPKETPNE